MSSFVLAKWQETENKLIRNIELYNSLDPTNMSLALDESKKALKDFFEVLREESEPVRAAFRPKQEMYLTEIERMAKGLENTKIN
jgi:hypothetical protein